MRKGFIAYFLGMMLALFLPFLGMAVGQSTEFSPNENRILNQFPNFSIKSFLQGEYQDKLEKAVNDQVLGRDYWTAAAGKMKQAEGLRDIGGVYLGKEGYLIPKYDEEDIPKFQYMENLRYVEYFASRMEGKSALMLIPNAGEVLKDKLPDCGTFYNSDALYSSAKSVCQHLKVLDLRHALRESEEQVYYKTDHHWTSAGAYLGYEAICEKLGMTKHTYLEYNMKCVTRDFLGTSYSKVLDSSIAPEKIYATGNDISDILVTKDGRKGKLFEESKLKEKDKYGYFLGGNYGEVQIKGRGNTGRKLLIIKDSFANSLVPFLVQDYDEITMIDFRYYRNTAKSLLEKHKKEDLLVIYELSRFAQEDNLWKISRVD